MQKIWELLFANIGCADMIKRHCVAFYNKIKNTQLAFKKMKVSRVFYIPDGVARASDSRLLLTAFLRHRAALHVLHRPDWPPWSGVSTYDLISLCILSFQAASSAGADTITQGVCTFIVRLCYLFKQT